MADTRHEPVLLQEAIEALMVQPAGRYIDCTLGRGGHASAIVGAGGRVLGIDADPQAIAESTRALEQVVLTVPRPASGNGSPFAAVHAHFDRLREIAHEQGFAPADGVLFDLGLSSPQLEDAARGFSFAKDGPLDMRFDPTEGDPADLLVNHAPVEDLARILREYGEEPQPRKMARAIDAARPIHSTGQLAAVIERAAGGRGRIHPATRIFQALRIATNRELERLSAALVQAVDALRQGGRLVVISFHSLEDRLVKQFMNDEARDCLCPPRTPVCVCGHKATLRVLSRKATTPGPDELRRNPRARSAKMRVAERI
jgi:16S rRNA (cytosine1402-N4)-methyltransferase